MATRKTKALSAAMVAMLAVATPFVAAKEGLRTTAYLDAVGVWTICYGETNGVKREDTQTKEGCGIMLKARLAMFGLAVDYFIDRGMSARTHAAFTSLAYNIGIEGFRTSSVARLYNQGKSREACEAIARKDTSSGRCRGYGCGWGGGKQLKGLQTRRIEEKNLCLSGI